MSVDTIHIIDNFFPKILYKRIQSEIFSDNKFWIYNPSRTYGKDKNLKRLWTEKNSNIVDVSAFKYIISPDQEFYGDLCKNIKFFVKEKFSLDVENIMRLTVNFMPPTPLIEDSNILGPHVDYNFPHKTLLIYMAENDADTLFFDKMHITEWSPHTPFSLNETNIIKKVTPKINRAVLFDGLIFHAAGLSKKFDRVTLNVNFN